MTEPPRGLVPCPCGACGRSTTPEHAAEVAARMSAKLPGHQEVSEAPPAEPAPLQGRYHLPAPLASYAIPGDPTEYNEKLRKALAPR